MRQDQFTVRAQEVIASAQSSAESADHAEVMVQLAREIQQAIAEYNAEKECLVASAFADDE